jgi:hypothetical protein
MGSSRIQIFKKIFDNNKSSVNAGNGEIQCRKNELTQQNH